MTRLVKLTTSIKRKEGLSIEEFNRYWSEHHCRVFMSMDIAKKNVVKYILYHVEPIASAELAQKAPVQDFDGSAIFYARSAEDLIAIFNDPQYLNIVVPDEERFIDRAATRVMIGYEEDKTHVNDC